MKKLLGALVALFALVSTAYADQALIIDAGYSTVTQNVKGRLEAAGHTVTVTTDLSLIPTTTGSYQQVWDLRYSAALTSGEQTKYQSFITNGGFAYFVTENPGCCMARNNSVAALITSLGGGSTQIGPGWANNVETNMNTTYMTNGLTVNYAAVAAIVNSQGIPLISDGSGAVSGMSWIGRADALGQGVTGTIITVADTNWLDQSRFVVGGTSAQQQNVQALDDIIRGVVAGTVAGTISASGNGSGATNGNSGGGSPPPPTLVSSAPGQNIVNSSTAYGQAVVTNQVVDGSTKAGKNLTVTRTTTPVTVTPYTVTTVTTPTTVDTYSDGSTVTTNGTAVTTTTSGDIITVGQSTSQSKTISASATADSIKAKNMNLFLIDPLSQNDGTWATPYAGYISSVGNYRMQGGSFGWQKTVENNSIGIAGNMIYGKAGNQPGSQSDSESYSGNMYLLSKQSFAWLKAVLGYSNTEHRTQTSIPEFALANNSKVRQNNYYADLGAYSADTLYGIRAVGGATINYSTLKGSESGSPLLSTLPENGGTTKVSPYFGLRYEYQKASFETRVYTNTEYKTVITNKASINQPIRENVFVNGTLGFDKSLDERYNNTYGTIGLRIAF
jgi:hypothetical protein